MMARRGMAKGKGKGYKNIVGTDKKVHSMSAKGIKQPQKINPLVISKSKNQKKIVFCPKCHQPKLSDYCDNCKIKINEKTKAMQDVADFYEPLYERNKGIFYRGQGEKGESQGFGVLGQGVYVTWRESMAKAFAKSSSPKGEGIVIEYELPKDLKLLDAQSRTMIEIKKDLGVKSYDRIADPLFARILTDKIKTLGFDGVISDDVADGIVVFDEKKLKKPKQLLNQEKFKKGWSMKTGVPLGDYPESYGYESKLIWMTPSEFLKKAQTGYYNAKSRNMSEKEHRKHTEYKEGIIRIKKGLKAGKGQVPIGWLEVSKDGNLEHEGRNRAWASIDLGIKKIPVKILWKPEYQNKPKWVE